MQAKHTPAPWVHKSFSNCDAVVANGAIIATVGLTADDVLPDDFDMTQQQADAKLIAAAPDLLQVAQHALYLIESGFEISPAGLADLRAAIAKAGAYDR